MAKTIEVTSTQVNAARLLVKQATARGESVPAAVAALANAKPLTDQADQQPSGAHTSNGSANGRATAPTTRTPAQPARPRFAG
jgi:hypothetical protein